MWGCIGIRQDGLGFPGSNQGIALSPLRSVSAKYVLTISLHVQQNSLPRCNMGFAL